jgi:septal ring factor EnvC (AmiA/AmiB activator)
MRRLLALAVLVAAFAGVAGPAAAQTVPIHPDPPYTSWTWSTMYAAVQSLQQHIQMLKNMKVDMRTAPGSWSQIQTDLQTITAAARQQHPATAVAAVQQQQLLADLAHLTQLTQLSDSTLGRTQKIDVSNKLMEALLANNLKQRALELAREQQRAADAAQLQRFFTGDSGKYVTPQ